MLSHNDRIFDAIIVGAGASGLWLAGLLGERGLKVLLIDGQGRSGRKLLLSGGGKCNVTNLSVSSDNYLGENPAFSEPALELFPPGRVLTFLKSHKIAWEERDYGQIFLKQGAEQIRDLFLHLIQRHGTKLILNRPVLSAGKQNGLFFVQAENAIYRGRRLTLCTGSPAWPASGAGRSGYALAASFGHRIVPLRPALTPLNAEGNWPLRELAGISLPVCISLGEGGKAYTLPLLLTHRGISGPAALQISSHWQDNNEVIVNWLPAHPCEQLLNLPGTGKRLLKNHLASRLPNQESGLPPRLIEALLPVEITDCKVAELSRPKRDLITRQIHNYRFVPVRPGFTRAEACRGGVSTDEINPFSMESLLCSGLFFAGEIVDICGELGGYNLHWAWASAAMAAAAHDG
ncbi:MAG: aminoacetone oxidase family FAD-binding enzyme [Desulfovibrionaceae bacterium]|nr:aminoacetone oxidase family FAD-binding enzyme [Desulfovibrionaceae bacterium]